MLKKNKELRKMTIVALGLSVIGVAFACVAMNVALSMKKTESVWDVNFVDLVVEKNGEATSEQPVINSTSMSDFHMTLKNKDDSVTYRFKLKNAGAVDARLKVISEMKPVCTVVDRNSASNVCNNVSYTLTYNDGKAVSTGDIIKSGFNKELTLKVEYVGNVSTEVEINNLDFILLFEQV